MLHLVSVPGCASVPFFHDLLSMTASSVPPGGSSSAGQASRAAAPYGLSALYKAVVLPFKNSKRKRGVSSRGGLDSFTPKYFKNRDIGNNHSLVEVACLLARSVP